MKLVLTTDKVYDIFINYKLPLVNIADAKTIESILSNRDRNDLSYVCSEALRMLKDKGNPLSDVVGMLENISYDPYRGESCVFPEGKPRQRFNTDISSEKQSYSPNEYPVIADALVVGDNCIILVLEYERKEHDYMGTIKTSTSAERSCSKSVAKKILGHLMCVNGLAEGLRLSSLKKIISCN